MSSGKTIYNQRQALEIFIEAFIRQNFPEETLMIDEEENLKTFKCQSIRLRIHTVRNLFYFGDNEQHDSKFQERRFQRQISLEVSSNPNSIA